METQAVSRSRDPVLGTTWHFCTIAQTHPPRVYSTRQQSPKVPDVAGTTTADTRPSIVLNPEQGAICNLPWEGNGVDG